ncbi:hypothetical protein SCARD494_07826 [Seiridium cardinale]
MIHTGSDETASARSTSCPGLEDDVSSSKPEACKSKNIVRQEPRKIGTGRRRVQGARAQSAGCDPVDASRSLGHSNVFVGRPDQYYLIGRLFLTNMTAAAEGAGIESRWMRLIRSYAIVKVMSGALRFSTYQVEITKSFPEYEGMNVSSPQMPAIDSRTNKNQRTAPEEGSICRVDGMAHRTATFMFPGL